MTVRKAGIDAGNNNLKIAVKGKQPFMIPAIYQLYLGEAASSMETERVSPEEIRDNIDITINSKALPKNNQRYVVGRLGSEMEENSDKSQDDMPVILTLAGLVVDALEDNPDKDRVEVNYDIGLNLPVSTISKETAKQYAEKFMGTHEVIFHHPNGEDVTVVIKVEYSRCLPEAASGAWGLVFDENGKPLKRTISIEDEEKSVELADMDIIHADIGAGTTELVVTKGVKYNSSLSRALYYGSKQTINKVREKWNQQAKPNKRINSVSDFNRIYMDPEHPRHNKLVSFSQDDFNQLANSLSTEIINVIDSVEDDPLIVIYGGGSIAVKETLRNILEKKERMEQVVFLQDPLFVNAKGLLVYTCSPRFEELKEKELGVKNNAEE